MVFGPQLVATMSENESLPALQSLVPCVIIYLFIYLFISAMAKPLESQAF